MKSFIFLFINMLIISGCATNSIEVKEGNGLVFNFKDKSSILASEVVETKRDNYNYLHIMKYRLEDEYKRVLFYEEVSTVDNYEFRYGALNTVKYIFNAKKVYPLYQTSELLMVQLETDLNQHVNIMIHSNDMENLSYVYGFSNYEFKKLSREMAKDSNKELGRLRYQGITLSKSDLECSRWSQSKLFLMPLTKRVNLRPNY